MQCQHERGNTSVRGTARNWRLREGAAWGLAVCCMHWGAAHAAGTSANTSNSGPVGARAQPLLPPLSTLVHSAAFAGTTNVSLGNTTFR